MALRRVFGTVVLVAAALALTGCMRVERDLRFNQDGSGLYVLTVGFRKPKAGDPGSVNRDVVTTLEVFGAHVEQSGGSVRRSSADGYASWSFVRPFDTAAQANELLRDDPRRFDAKQSPLLFNDTLEVVETSSLFSQGVQVRGYLSLADPFGKSEAWKDATETLTITMPEGVGSYEGGTLDGNTVRYTIGYNQSTPVNVRGETGQPGRAGVPDASLLLAAAVLAAAVTGATLALALRQGLTALNQRRSARGHGF